MWIELTTPGLQDQCSSHWAMEAYTDLTGFYDNHALCIYTVYEVIYDNPALIRLRRTRVNMHVMLMITDYNWFQS